MTITVDLDKKAVHFNKKPGSKRVVEVCNFFFPNETHNVKITAIEFDENVWGKVTERIESISFQESARIAGTFKSPKSNVR